MRDGITLNATIYKPQGQKEALPVILLLTPYISDNYHQRGVYFSKNGYVFAIADTRGRGSSEGNFDPFIQEARDGYDAIEWLAGQSYCNGKVAMWGGSYSGYVQWAVAKEIPAHLKTIVPAAAVKPGIDFPMQYNVGSPYTIQWLTNISGKTGNDQLFDDKDYWAAKFNQRYQHDRAFNSIDTIACNPSSIFQYWLMHPVYDTYYKSMSPSPQQYAQLNFPILTITGHYDDDQAGAITYYREFMAFADAAAKKNHYLIIGPWDHAGTRTPGKKVGGLQFGDASLLDMNALHKQWYDFTLKNGSLPPFLKNKIAYFVSNRNTWKYAASLDDIGRHKQVLFLDAASEKTNSRLPGGKLQTTVPQHTIPAAYTYDPLDKTPRRIYAGLTGIDENYLTCQRLADGPGNTGAIYHSKPFEQATEVSGFFELKACIETDVKDVDIVAAVYEARADGSTVLLTTQTIRARYRDGLEKEKLLQAGEVNLFHFNKFSFISRVIEKGSRIRLIITSPNSMYIQKNYCSGGEVAKETAKDAHTAHIKIHNSSQYQSALFIPAEKN